MHLFVVREEHGKRICVEGEDGEDAALRAKRRWWAQGCLIGNVRYKRATERERREHVVSSYVLAQDPIGWPGVVWEWATQYTTTPVTG